MPNPTRRQLLAASAGLPLLGAGLPGTALAGVSASDRLFIFVFAMGGWNVPSFFAPLFGYEGIDMEARAEEALAGNIPWVYHPDRPSMRTFIESAYDRVAFLQGVQIPSVSHSVCRALAFTGTIRGERADWATLIAAAQADRYALPHLIVSGPSYAGEYGGLVGYLGSENRLLGLLNGDLLLQSDQAIAPPPDSVSSAIDAWLGDAGRRRIARARTTQEAEMLQKYVDSLTTLEQLKVQRDVLDMTIGSTATSEIPLITRVLSSGLSRCVTTSWPAQRGRDDWDSHAADEPRQTLRFQQLGSDLLSLLQALDRTEGPAGGTLADQTTIVVFSEMGRTPALNGVAGRDHWPYSTAMLIGGGFTANRVIGGWSTGFTGRGVDRTTGEIDDNAALVGMDSVGATLLAMADIDPRDVLPESASPILGMLD
jgi:hypothetical protein